MTVEIDPVSERFVRVDFDPSVQYGHSKNMEELLKKK
jgi:hypothetical protein